MRGFTRRRFTLIMVFAWASCVYAQATDLKVNCNGAGALSTINGALKLLNLQGPNTLTVSGSCHENVNIQSFDRLTLQAAPGASINDASGGTIDVITIVDSQRITIQGFTITGGGDEVIICLGHSFCRFNGNTIQASASTGVSVSRSSAEFSGNVIQNNPDWGLDIREAGQVLMFGDKIQGSGAEGVRLEDGSYLLTISTTVQNNGGSGIRLIDHATLRSQDSTITRNGGSGVSLEGASAARFAGPTGNVITGNSGNGVSINDLSFANFERRNNNVSGNTTQPDVACNPQFSAERGALPSSNIGGGTTNCVEP